MYESENKLFSISKLYFWKSLNTSEWWPGKTFRVIFKTKLYA